MTGKEIIAKRITKGLECCEFEYPPCRHCHYQICGLRECKKILIKDAYYLVKTQQKEIERLNKENKILEYRSDVLTLSNEQKESKIAELTVEKKVVEDNAIRQFAEKLKDKAKPFLAADILGTDDVDELVKEMVGADNGRTP